MEEQKRINSREVRQLTGLINELKEKGDRERQQFDNQKNKLQEIVNSLKKELEKAIAEA